MVPRRDSNFFVAAMEPFGTERFEGVGLGSMSLILLHHRLSLFHLEGHSQHWAESLTSLQCSALPLKETP